MTRYEHTQRGTVLLAALLAGAAFCLFLPTAASIPPAIPLLTGGILAVCAVLFYSLTIQITDRTLRWHFGPGLIRKEAPLSDIQTAEIIRTRVIHRWGIHLTPRGWLYNVSGFQAVAVKRKSGKEFLLGTDEPERLRAAILRAVS